ncbi:hypothetical protein XPN_0843, partial [Xanthomonas arboricola pv. pruni MAFF 301427]
SAPAGTAGANGLRARCCAVRGDVVRRQRARAAAVRHQRSAGRVQGAPGGGAQAVSERGAHSAVQGPAGLVRGPAHRLPRGRGSRSQQARRQHPPRGRGGRCAARRPAAVAGLAGRVAAGAGAGAVAGWRGQPAQLRRDFALVRALRGGRPAAACRLHAGSVRRSRARGRRWRRSGAAGATARHRNGDGAAASGRFRSGGHAGGGRAGRVRRRAAATAGVCDGRGKRGHGPPVRARLRPAVVDLRQRQGRKPQRGLGHRRVPGRLARPRVGWRVV